MLIPPSAIKEMCNFEKEELQLILRNSGYPETKLLSAEFKGMNKDGQFVYETVAVYGDGPAEERVYVQRIWHSEHQEFVYEADY